MRRHDPKPDDPPQLRRILNRATNWCNDPEMTSFTQDQVRSFIRSAFKAGQKARPIEGGEPK